MAKEKEKLAIPPVFAIGQVTNAEEFMEKLCPHHGLIGKVSYRPVTMNNNKKIINSELEFFFRFWRNFVRKFFPE